MAVPPLLPKIIVIDMSPRMNTREAKQSSLPMNIPPPCLQTVLLDMIPTRLSWDLSAVSFVKLSSFKLPNVYLCSHKFCKACISRFKDCPLCGADIDRVEPDEDLQATVDRFIDGHAKIKRPLPDKDSREVANETNMLLYGDISFDRGAFLVQQAIRAFRSHNILSAKSRLVLCAEDIREQIQKLGNSSELSSQLGAVLGMLGDCCRAMEDSSSAITYFEESVEFLSKLDLKMTLDVAISLAKVADVDRGLGNEGLAVDGFQQAVKCLESLTVDSNETGLEQKRQSVLHFLYAQLTPSS